MKTNKIITTLFVFLLASLSIFAQKNEISIPDVSVVAGKSINLPIYLDNTEDVVAVQFTLELADGFSLQTDAATLTERASAHSLVIKEIAHNKYMAMVFSSTNSPVVGRTGILLYVPLSAQATMTDQTTYPMTLSDVIIAGNTGDNLLTNSHVGEITIAASADFEVSNVTTNTNLLTPNGKLIVNWQVANIGGLPSSAGWKENIYIEAANGYSKYIGSIYHDGILDVNGAVSRSAELIVPAELGVEGEATVRVKLVANSDAGEYPWYTFNNEATSNNTLTIQKVLLLQPATIHLNEKEPAAYRWKLIRSGNTNLSETFTLNTTEDSRVELPNTITIPASQSGAYIDFQLTANATLDSDSVVLLRVQGDNYNETNGHIIITDDTYPTLTVQTTTPSIQEGSELLLSLTAQRAANHDVEIKITSDITDVFDIPASVVLPAGQTSMEIRIPTIDDDMPNPDRTCTLSLSAAQYEPTTIDVLLSDNDIPELHLTLTPNAISEAAGPLSVAAKITRKDNIDKKLTLRLYDDSEGAIYYGQNEMEMPAGVEEINVNVGPVDNALVDGERTYNITAAIYSKSCSCNAISGESMGIATAPLTIYDNDGATLAGATSASVLQEGGEITITVSHNTSTEKDITVAISSDYETQLEYPSSIVIPAGKSSATFVVKSKGNTTTSDDYTAILTLSAEGYAKTNVWFMVSDQTLPDAQITNFNVSNNEIEVGDSLRVDITITNTGSYELPKFTQVGVYVDNISTAIATLYLQKELQVGEQAVFTRTITMPSTIGTYNIYAVANDNYEIKELCYTNNSSNIVVVNTISPYSVHIYTDKLVYKSGDKTIIYGNITGDDVAGKDVEVYIINDNYRHTISAKTDNVGDFSVEYEPYSGQMGHFIAGACYPKEGLRTEMLAFDYYGVKRTSNVAITCEALLGDTYSGRYSVSNPGNLPISNVSVEVVSKPENCNVAVSCPNNVNANSIFDVDFAIDATSVSIGNTWQKIELNLTTAEGVSLPTTLYYYCRNKEGQLKASVTSVNTTITKGISREYPFLITNIGKGETGNITIEIPSWMSLATPREMGPLAYGDSATIILRLTSTEDMQLNVPLTGSIGLNCVNGQGLSLPFCIEPVSESTGTMIIDVCDENTYYTVEKPHVAGATVTVSHPATGATVISGITGENGQFQATLPEGYYAVTVSAPNHNSYKNNLLVDPGVENLTIVNLSMEAITVDWTVEETTVQDEYSIVTTVTYETNVPVPIVELNVPQRIEATNLSVGESLIFYATLTNKGLITAEDVQLELPTEFSALEFEALSNNEPFSLAPQQSVRIPVKVTHTNKSRVESMARIRPIDDDPCIGSVGTLYYWDCGLDRKWHRYCIALQVGTCRSDDPSTWDNSTSGYSNYGCGGGGPVSGPGFGGGYYFGSTWGRSDVTTIQDEGCEPCQNQMLWKLVECGLSFIPIYGCVRGSYDCARESFDGETGWRHNVNCALTGLGCTMELCEGASLSTVVGAPAAAVCGIVGIITNVISCLISFTEPCDREGAALRAKDGVRTMVNEPDYLVEFRSKAEIPLAEINAWSNILTEIFGDSVWVTNTTMNELYNLLFELYHSNDEILASDKYIAYKPQRISKDDFIRFIDRLNNTYAIENGNNIDSSNYINNAKLKSLYDLIEECESNSIALGYNSTDEMWLTEAEKCKEKLDGNSSVCASISLQFSQKMVLTRQGFRGTLTVFNGNETTAMSDIKLGLIVKDENGNIATSHEFQINPETLTGFEGELSLETGWTLPSQQTGEATILFIPTKYAAPMVDKVYSFGGTLSYIDPFTGLEVTRVLSPISLTVKPSPNLDLTYFMQRDVLGDDPLTEAIESSEEAEFSLLINNVGYGDANNVRMTTNQPEIIDNEKGLLIDFEIMSAQLNGQEKVLALGGSVDTDFGNIPAQSTSYAQWWLKSSLLGHFTEYNVEATHVTSYGNPDLSLLNEVTIHELIRSIDATSNNQPLVGFMANDIVDAEDMPDMMYLSNGLVEKVAIAQSATMTKHSDEAYILTVTPSQLDWNYGSVSDPTYGLAQLKAITRQSDGKSISLRNIWQTDRTLRDGKDPLYENRIHFVDDFATTATESYLLTFEPTPDLFLEISSFAGVPAEGVVLDKPLDKLTVTFNKTIDPITFTTEDITLTVEGKKIDISSVVLTTKDNQTFTIDLSKVTDNMQNGYHVLSVQTNAISDTESFTGRNGKSTNWLAYNADGITLQTSVYPQHAGTIKCSHVGADNNTVVSNVVDYGTTITLTANPIEGYNFVNWTINGEEVSSASTMEYVVLGDDIQITANFTEKMFTLDVASDIIGGAIEGVVSGIYPFGTAFTIQPTPEYGYTFSHWLINDVNVGTNPTMDISVDQPLTISAQFVREIYTQRLVTYQGWNWLSSYLQEPIAIEEFTDLSNHIVSQLDEIIKDPLFGFIGGISSLEGGVAYKVQSSMAFARVLEGHLYDASSNPISLHMGWNWIGYPYYEERPLTAIQNPTEGDYITAQEGFAEFADGYWQGTISSLMPGSGYLYKSADSKQLIYNFAANATPAHLPKKQIATTDNVLEEVDIHQYPNTMNITAKLYNGNQEMSDGHYTIYAMCGNECRGIGVAVGNYYYITIYGDEAVEISFVIENQMSGETYVANEMLLFNGDVVGSRSKPYIIDVAAKVPTNLENTDNGLQTLTIYNVLGVLLNNNASLTDLQTLPQGIYIVGGQKYYVK